MKTVLVLWALSLLSHSCNEAPKTSEDKGPAAITAITSSKCLYNDTAEVRRIIFQVLRENNWPEQEVVGIYFLPWFSDGVAAAAHVDLVWKNVYIGDVICNDPEWSSAEDIIRHEGTHFLGWPLIKKNMIMDNWSTIVGVSWFKLHLNTNPGLVIWLEEGVVDYFARTDNPHYWYSKKFFEVLIFDWYITHEELLMYFKSSDIRWFMNHIAWKELPESVAYKVFWNIAHAVLYEFPLNQESSESLSYRAQISDIVADIWRL